ncbi:antibiotic biosynthesis monooxygenase family protein [Sorangium sp. So ce131]|uniref:antibiotic biosynthesis monooxygenase family protein n=1 Tax=Sorangium sp. So ce131 TaxID=3133282 RepID=UPI003F62440A
MPFRTRNRSIGVSQGQFAAALLSLLGTIVSGCSSDFDAQTPDDPTSVCASGALEADLEAGPATGPGVDPETGEILPPPAGSVYTVSSTYGVRRAGDAVAERHGQMFEAIEAQLASQPGLVALQLAFSPSCGAGRTLAVWASTEQMYDFVLSPPHAAAMNVVDELVEPGYGVTHWEASTTDEMTFAEGARRLAANVAATR